MQISKIKSPSRRQRLELDEAGAMAAEALTYLAADPPRLERFMALSGLTLGTLRAAAREPCFLGAILDYLASDEPLLLAFAASAGHDPADVMRARDMLSGSPSQ
ncbi:MAG TPA: DUF3572 domain-containing protein [Methylocella sp.]|nr:DUF3572 domain-containing protein [Methylocella sp.]